MDENFKKQMEDNGADVNGTLKRFMGSEKMYMKFIMKFLDDKNCAGLKENLQNRDFEGAFASAHALKGVTANLGLDPVNVKAAEISELLRNKQPQEVDEEKVNELMGQLEEEQKRFCQILQAYKPV